MPAVHTTRYHLLNLYWLGYLLTGDRYRGMEAATNVLHQLDDGDTWSTSRKFLIEQAFRSVAGQLRESIRRLGRRPGAVPRDWVFDTSAGKPELERALLGVDLFPRWALLLLVFEGLRPEKVTRIVDADEETLISAKAIGLVQLTRNLSSAQPPAGVHAQLFSLTSMPALAS